MTFYRSRLILHEVTIQKLIIILFSMMLLFSLNNQVYAFLADPIVKLSKPSLKSNYSYGTAGVRVGQEYVIATTISRDVEYEGDVPFVVFVEARDSNGVTQYLASQFGKLSGQIYDQTEIGSSWTPDSSGMFSLRTFAISDMENPMILSQVYESIIYVGAHCGGNAECIQGVVTRIVDGDTLDIGDTRIRLALVNTPEIDEPGYNAAKEFTSTLCPPGSYATADEDDGQTEGSFGRMIAKLTCGDKILNAELLYEGQAEILTRFCSVSEFSDEVWAQDYGCQNAGDSAR